MLFIHAGGASKAYSGRLLTAAMMAPPCCARVEIAWYSGNTITNSRMINIATVAIQRRPPQRR
ncbi:hypothetical protein D3C85_1460160 [compost metagenome]